jgi:hypothetical protein
MASLVDISLAAVMVCRMAIRTRRPSATVRGRTGIVAMTRSGKALLDFNIC